SSGPHTGIARHHSAHEESRESLVPDRHRARRVVPQPRVPGGMPEASRLRWVRQAARSVSCLPPLRGDEQPASAARVDSIVHKRAAIIAAAIAVAATTLASSLSVNAEPVADFYRGKTLRMLIGYGPGGGYDIYGRLVVEFLPRHLPGAPTIIAQNMPGAGSFVAAKYIYDVAPKDGT